MNRNLRGFLLGASFGVLLAGGLSKEVYKSDYDFRLQEKARATTREIQYANYTLPEPNLEEIIKQEREFY